MPCSCCLYYLLIYYKSYVYMDSPILLRAPQELTNYENKKNSITTFVYYAHNNLLKKNTKQNNGF